jgi:hypothetical protein
VQHRINEIQQELQILTENMTTLNPNAIDYNKQKQSILIKTERMKKEFRENLMKLQTKQSLNSYAIPSDDVNKK